MSLIDSDLSHLTQSRDCVIRDSDFIDLSTATSQKSSKLFSCLCFSAACDDRKDALSKIELTRTKSLTDYSVGMPFQYPKTLSGSQ